MDWEVLASLPKAAVRRRGRFIVADLLEDHRVISTSQINGGEVQSLRHLVNHQCCEGKDHNDRFHLIVAKGEDVYHETVCAEIELPPAHTAMMATAANMNYAACAARQDADVEVLAVVTAGVETNAVCAGDPAVSRETSAGVVSAIPVGTINTILLSNMPLSPGALARTVITMAEAKSAALQRLAVPSCYSSDLATGTGTDQYCIAAPLEGPRTLKIRQSAHEVRRDRGPRRPRRDAGSAALAERTGGELHARPVSCTRPLRHQGEDDLRSPGAAILDAASLELLRKNNKSVFYEPLVGAAAHATASVLDRARFGTLPPAALKDAIVQQAASLAASLAAKPDRWPEFRAALHATPVAEPVEPDRARHRARLEREVEGLTGAARRAARRAGGRCRSRSSLGDPVYRFHPVRLIGASLTAIENGLRRIGADGYGGGIVLFVILASIWVFVVAYLQMGFTALGPWPGWLFHVSVVYSLLALGDLVRAIWRVERALERQDLAAARFAISRLVGRDTDRMDEGACRRAAIESLSENLPDGFISAMFWYVLLGLPGTRRVQGGQHHGLDGRLQDAALSALRMVRRAPGRRDEFRARAPDVASAECKRRRHPRRLTSEGARHGLSPGETAAESEFRLAGSGNRGRHSAASVGADLEERPTGDGHLARRSGRSSCVRPCRHDARDRRQCHRGRDCRGARGL